MACESNLDCTAPGTRCDKNAGLCVCNTDEACQDGQFCNRAGVCQEFSGCNNNSDCAARAGTYCDAASGQCLEGPALMLNSPCGLATHCPYGTLCVDGSCVPGCGDDGDCPLGQVCFNNQCVSGNGVCADNTFCGYGELCSTNTAPGTCREDHRGPYCNGCTFRTDANPEPCDHPRNFCLINNFETGSFTNFCGVDCSLGQPCPNGYNCGGVVILTDDVCVSQAQCRCDPQTITFATATCTIAAACDDPDNEFCRIDSEPACNHGQSGGPAACFVRRGERFGSCLCATDEDCAGGGSCVGGQCCGRVVRTDRDCVSGENRISGFCTCATDSDCPRDVCDGSRGACAISGLPCEPGQNDCGAIPCVDGGCVIGANCAPEQGLSCSIVTAD